MPAVGSISTNLSLKDVAGLLVPRVTVFAGRGFTTTGFFVVSTCGFGVGLGVGLVLGLAGEDQVVTKVVAASAGIPPKGNTPLYEAMKG